MVDFDLAMGMFWVICGIVILVPAYLIAIRGRADLHIHYDDAVDPEYVSKRAGATALAMGLITIGYGLSHIVIGYHPAAFGGLLLSLLVLSYATKRFAQGYGYTENIE